MAPSSNEASSALVNIAEDAELRLVRLLAETSSQTSTPVATNFVQTCEASIVHSDASQLIKCILNEQGAIAALVSLNLDNNEAVSAISLLAALLDRIKDGDTVALVKQLADSIGKAATSASTVEATSRCLSLLAAIYNMRSDPKEKVALLVKMITLGAKDSLLSQHNSVLGKWVDEKSTLPQMLDDWSILPAGRRELYSAAAAGATSTTAKQRFTLLLVETYAAGVRLVYACVVAIQCDPVF